MADDNGGGLVIEDSVGTTISVCDFFGNSASEQGGGLQSRGFLLVSEAVISDCMFENNEAGEEGGGLASYASTLVLSGCTFNGNMTQKSGTAIYNAQVAVNSAEIRAKCHIAIPQLEAYSGGFDWAAARIVLGRVVAEQSEVRNIAARAHSPSRSVL